MQEIIWKAHLNAQIKKLIQQHHSAGL